MLGLGEPEGAPAGVVVRSRPRPGLAGRALAAASLPWRARGRVLLCLDPELLPAARLRRLTGRRLVVDVHEDYQALLRDRAWAAGLAGRGARAVVAASTRLAAGADLTVVADEHLPPLAARERLVVRNLPDTTMLPAPGPLGPVPRALYVGDLRTTRGLFVMLDAIEQAPGWELDLVGPVAPRDRARFDAWLATSPAAERVRWHGRLPPAKAWALAEGAWVGLALLDRTPAFEAALPTKLYEYLACGLGVLVTPLPRMADLVTQQGVGQVVSDAAATAQALLSWSDDGAALERCRNAAVEVARGNGSSYDDLAAQVAVLAGVRPRADA